MIHTVIFDLSEVIIAGVVGVDQALAPVLNVPPEQIFPSLGGRPFWELLCGEIDEETYFRKVLDRRGWTGDIDSIKKAIRSNFHNEVEGTREVLEGLAQEYRLILLSDHAREWIEYIEQIHPILELFDRRFYSFDLGSIKKDPDTFRKVLSAIDCTPDEVLFIDDQIRYVETAQSVGIQSIVFQSAPQLISELSTILSCPLSSYTGGEG